MALYFALLALNFRPGEEVRPPALTRRNRKCRPGRRRGADLPRRRSSDVYVDPEQLKHLINVERTESSPFIYTAAWRT
jgi:hypothetical protein